MSRGRGGSSKTRFFLFWKNLPFFASFFCCCLHCGCRIHQSWNRKQRNLESVSCHTLSFISNEESCFASEMHLGLAARSVKYNQCWNQLVCLQSGSHGSVCCQHYTYLAFKDIRVRCSACFLIISCSVAATWMFLWINVEIRGYILIWFTRQSRKTPCAYFRRALSRATEHKKS